VALAELDEALHPSPQLPEATGRRLDHAQLVGEGPQLVDDVQREDAEQVLLAGEVQVEGPVRGPGPADDVVDPGGVVAVGGERLGAGVEEAPHGALPPRAQRPPLRRRAGADGPVRGQSPFSRMNR
jgi:hypothetical protein